MRTIHVWVRHPDFLGERSLYVLWADEGCAEACVLGARRYYQGIAEETVRAQQQIPREWELYWQDWRSTPEGEIGLGYLRPIENGMPTRDEELPR